jgi:nucleoside 2-deoxyribosyltransferase
MSRCFVIQPFDKGRFDKRYDDVFAPAIRDAGLEPYRVDRDPSVTIPIENIQAEIESSDICLAEITTDNPNVWFELGYAIASQREVVLVCSEERQSRFPFDVQHRSVIRYSTESSSDFDELRSQITARLKAVLNKKAQLAEVRKMPSIAKVEGLEQYEIAALVTVAQQIDHPEDGISPHRVREDMGNAGFMPIAVTLGLRALLDKGMLSVSEDRDYNGEVFAVYKVTGEGMSWLFANQNKLTLLRVANSGQKQNTLPPPPEDDIPF